MSEYKKDKQYVVENRVCIGKMIDDKNMNPNDNFFQYFEVEGGIDEQPPRFCDVVQVGAPTLILKIMEDLKISELLNSIHGEQDATPLFYEMYPGSIMDNTQCTHMVDRAKEYGYKNVGLILDRGYFSAGNIRYFDQMGYDFLMMVKNNSGKILFTGA